MRLFCFVSLFFVVFAGTALAQSPRLALIITNADYPDEIGRLAKTHDDGDTIGSALRDVGFSDVRHVKDADFQTMRLELANFVERIEKAGPNAVVFFYYSGHGAADRVARGENFLIPTKAPIKTAKQLPLLGLGLGEIVRTLERVPAKARFAVIDACRNVAFTKGLKNAAKGFVPMRKLDGILLAFATRPGEVAHDEGLYSRALAKHIRQPGLPPERVFKLTQIAVAKESKGNQVPWIEDGLLVEGFRFRSAEKEDAVASVARPSKATPVRRPICDGVSVKLSTGQTVCIKPGSGKSFKDCDVCPELVLVPAGNFIMGALKPDYSHSLDELPPRRVSFARPFAVGRFEVTFAEWDECVAEGGCQHKPSDHSWGRDTRPVIDVSWKQINEQYLPWLSRKTGKSYRLLTEAEWEYVARTGTAKLWRFSGNERSVCDTENLADKSLTSSSKVNVECSDGVGAMTSKVGRYQPNPWGLHDVFGNVEEWVEDCYQGSIMGYQSAPIDGSAVVSKKCQRRVLRGGSWKVHPSQIGSTKRSSLDPGVGDRFRGFRVATDLQLARAEDRRFASRTSSNFALIAPQLRRGLTVFMEVCSACHSLSNVTFSNLSEANGPGLPKKSARKLAAQFEVLDKGQNRPATLFDQFPNPYKNERDAAEANLWFVPPDLTSLAARKGTRYIREILLGYGSPPAGEEELSAGLFYNSAIPGGAIAMAKPLSEGMVEYRDGTKPTMEQMAKDVARFLEWASTKHTNDR